MIDADKINILIKEGEGLTVEFKERYTPKIDRDIVAFANSKGGLLLLGVDDKGKVVGEKLTNKMKAEINAIARNCDPSIHLKNIRQVGQIVVIEVASGDQEPYSSSSGYFRRLDAVTQKMTQREVRSIFRETEDISFEDIACKDLSLKEISLKKVKSFLQEANMSYKISKANLASFLTSLSIYRKDKINNAGALMFASKVEKFIPHTESIFAAFKGTDKTNIYDRNDVKDDLLIQFNEAVAFLKKHLNVRSEIRGFDRFDIYEIPLDALREAVVNAIVHRDYRFKGTSIYIRIYDDRVEIENPGGLPDGITRRDFGKSSVRRNPIIADLFHRMGKVERMGSGIERMRELMRDAGLKEPVFEMDAFFWVTFYRDPRYSLKTEKVGERAEKIRRKYGEKGAEDTTRKITQKRLAEKLVERLVESQQRILELIKENPYISKKELSEIIGISTTAIDKNIQQLKKKGLLKRIGPDKGGYWGIVNG
jgi:ATP-dependent DNA helicase RecG